MSNVSIPLSGLICDQPSTSFSTIVYVPASQTQKLSFPFSSVYPELTTSPEASRSSKYQPLIGTSNGAPFCSGSYQPLLHLSQYLKI